VVKLVLDTIQALQQQGRQVSQLSFVGYSLGGLILR
jgi:biotin operon repressor